MPSGRTLPGKYTYDGLGAGIDTRRVNAFGRGPADKRRVTTLSLGLSHREARTASEGGDLEDVDLADIVLSRSSLRRGKLATMAESLKGGLKADDAQPLTGYRDDDGKVVLTDGNHRAATMVLDGKKGKVQVRIAKMKLAKAGPKGKMKMIAGILESRGVKPEDCAEECDMKPERMKALMAGEDEPTDDEVKAMMSAAGKLGKADDVKPTAEDKRLGADAKAQAAAGSNPASWVADEDVWDKAKAAAAKTYDESDDVYWPAVVHIYGKMGGEIKAAAKKSLAKADLGLSLRELEHVLYVAARAKYGVHVWVRDVFPEAGKVVIDSSDMNGSSPYGSGKLYWAEYEVGDDGSASIGEWEEVQRVEDYEPVKKAALRSRLQVLVAAAIAKTGTGAGGLARAANVDQGLVDAVLERRVAWLGDNEAGRLAEVLGLGIASLREMLDEDAAAEKDVPAEQAPLAHGDLAKRTVEYVAVPDGDSHLVKSVDGEAGALAAALAEIPGVVAAEAERSGVRLILTDERARGHEVAIKATVNVPGDNACGEASYLRRDEPARAVKFVGTPAALRKAAEKGIVYGVVYSPDDVDLQGEWATAEDIEEAAHEYLVKSRQTRRQHGDVSDDEVVESYVAPCDLRLNGEDVKKGAWVVVMKLGTKSRDLVKNGKMTGFSMGGSCRRVEAAA